MNAPLMFKPVAEYGSAWLRRLKPIVPAIIAVCVVLLARQVLAQDAAASSGTGSTGTSTAATPVSSGSGTPALSGSGTPAAASTPCGTDSSGAPACGQEAGNPINVTNGNKYQREVDMPALPGVLGLELVRHYNSSQSRLSDAPGLFGRGWRLSYDWNLRFDHAAKNETLVLVKGDGTEVGLAKRRTGKGWDGTWWPQGRPDGRLEEIRLQTRTEYLWTSLSGQRYRFSERGLLMAIEAPTGEVLSIEREGKGDVTRITDPQGRELRFELLSDAKALHEKRFGGAQAVVTPVGRYEYRYGGDAPATSVVPAQRLLNRLISVDHAGIRRVYLYEDADKPSLLTGIRVAGKGSDGVDMNVRIVTWAYDKWGRAYMSLRGENKPPTEAASQMQGTPAVDSLERVTLHFLPPRKDDRGRELGTTILSNSLGQKTIYRFVKIQGRAELTEVIGAGCASCGETNVRYVYDEKGLVLETIKLQPVVIAKDIGLATAIRQRAGKPVEAVRLVYDELGRPSRREQRVYSSGKLSEAQAEVRVAYGHAEFPLNWRPALIARPSVLGGREHLTRISYNPYGQVVSIMETGFSPLNDEPIKRTTEFRYAEISGRSLLVEKDGPLQNGPRNDPSDSDVSRFEWNAQGSRLRSIQEAGKEKGTVKSDKAGRLMSITHGERGTTRYEYDDHGRLSLLSTGEERPGLLNTAVAFRYDALGRRVEDLQATANGSGMIWRPVVARGFDITGRLLWNANALGVLERSHFDAEGRLIESGRHSALISEVLQYRYAENGSLALVVDNAGRRWNFAGESTRIVSTARRNVAKAANRSLDDFGRLVRTAGTDGNLVSIRYDENDRPIAMTDSMGNEATYSWDIAGRITAQSLRRKGEDQAEITRWAYQGERLKGVSHPAQDEEYEYDNRGLRISRIVTLKTPDGTISVSTRYDYDETGKLRSYTLPDGSEVVMKRNGQGQIVSLHRNRFSTPWDKWFGSGAVIAGSLERDMLGLRSWTAGNGVRTQTERTKDGVLLRHSVVSSGVSRNLKTVGFTGSILSEALAGTDTAKTVKGSERRGDLTGRVEDAAILDHHYLWDQAGNLMFQKSKDRETSFAYDQDDRLVIAQSVKKNDQRTGQSATDFSSAQDRYLYDALGRRVLSEENLSQEGRAKLTKTNSFRGGSYQTIPEDFDLTGLPRSQGSRQLTWDAAGRLRSVLDGQIKVEYTYDHRGLRNAKIVRSPAGRQVTYYVYDESRNLQAELDIRGKVRRQYVYLADTPVALIDGERSPARATGNSAFRIFHDLRGISDQWLSGEKVTWLHANHLNAPEAATDESGAVVWEAEYSAFGRARVKAKRHGFSMQLRLPGQYEDGETGWHYNRLRYYDPDQGRYLSPDPSGAPDGADRYAYVRNNPLKYVDPDGLVLFAFDGTGNSNDLNDPGMAGNGLSNVYEFFRTYSDRKRYMAGVGTIHRDTLYGDIVPDVYAKNTRMDWLTASDPLYLNDMGGNYSGPARIDRMMRYFRDELDLQDDSQAMQVDIVGFSRGAAEARDFANRIASPSIQKTVAGSGQKYWTDGTFRQRDAAGVEQTYYRYARSTSRDPKNGVMQFSYTCQQLNFRFMGLWDSVLSTNWSGSPYNLAIPAAFANVAHAVALNEYRSDTLGEWAMRNPLSHNQHMGGFPLESIGPAGNTPGAVRVERGFLGAHADIGGGYPDSENKLSKVALAWMERQALDAGIKLISRVTTPTGSAILHDQSNAINLGDPRGAVMVGSKPPYSALQAEDREVRGAFSGTTQRAMRFNNNGMTNADTHQFIRYFSRSVAEISKGTSLDPRVLANRTGTVDLDSYVQWLQSHGYTF